MSSHDILVAGECLIDFFPVDDSASIAPETFQRRAGGAPANVAVALAELGTPPLFWTSIGDDAFGEYLKSVLNEASIPSRFVIQREENPTGLAFVDGTVEGGFKLYLSETATVDFDINDIPETIFSEVEWVHLGGVLLAQEPARAAMFEFLKQARSHDCTISFDPNTRPSIWPSTDECARVLNEVLRLVDVVIGHADDFPAEVLPDDAPDIAEELLDRGILAVVITKGAAGAEVKTHTDSPWGGCHYKHPGFHVNVTDTTGAGDAFTAAFISSLLEEDTSIPDALMLANASGAIVTTQMGAIAALPDLETVRTWIQEQSSKKC